MPHVDLETTQLGKHLSEHKLTYFSPLLNLGCGVMLLGVIAVGLSGAGNLLPVALIVVLAIWLIWRGWNRLGQRLIIYEHGLQMVTRRGITSWRWDDFTIEPIEKPAGESASWPGWILVGIVLLLAGLASGDLSGLLHLPGRSGRHGRTRAYTFYVAGQRPFKIYPHEYQNEDRLAHLLQEARESVFA